ncbi:MAG: BamA/TamA family outer membrane protein [Ignavibacteria bacterium]|nr:BamA/TamA family outer membrane protein [Ignavibacteria bacterium]
MVKARLYKATITLFCFFIQQLSLSLIAKNSNYLQTEGSYSLLEIGEVTFEGNKSFPAHRLQSIISSKPTTKSIPHKIVSFYYTNIKKNPAAPKSLIKLLQTTVNQFSDEISLYKENRVESDKRTLELFYYQQGFHEVKVNYTISFNKENKSYVLKFIIDEGPQYLIDFIEISGLENISQSLLQEIESLRNLRKGIPFNEPQLAEDLTKTRILLRENGFYYADFKTPKVVIDTSKKIDSVFVEFLTGKPVRINKITFIDSTNGQNRVGYNVKLNHLDFREGDLYNQRKVVSSEINLSSLGTFELVRIDTSSAFAPITDTSISMAILLRYRKLRDFGLGLFTNRTSAEKAINLGVELSINDRNIFGGGQSANLFFRTFAIDVSRALLEKKPLEYELQTGFYLVQPLLWTIRSSRVGLSSSMLYSQRKVFRALQLNTFTFSVKFPTRLPFWTYFNFLDIDFNFERQVPKNFESASSEFYKSATSFQDSLRIQQAISIFGNLNKYIREENPFLTSAIFAINIVGDNRDNPLMPQSGRLTNLGIDGYFLFGMAKFYRISLTFQWFWNLNNRLVLASKIRGGHIFWLDKENSFVPFDRHFFAGGANSIRGWASRQLRYHKGIRVDTSSSELVNIFLRDFVGNASIFESSVELRFRFGRPAYIDKTLASILELLTITLFLDAGNSYQWLVKGQSNKYAVEYTLKDYIFGIALAGGFGIGFITPAGPLFIDVGFPFFDPNKERKFLDKPLFHIRLGYSF